MTGALDRKCLLLALISMFRKYPRSGILHLFSALRTNELPCRLGFRGRERALVVGQGRNFIDAFLKELGLSSMLKRLSRMRHRFPLLPILLQPQRSQLSSDYHRIMRQTLPCRRRLFTFTVNIHLLVVLVYGLDLQYELPLSD